MKPRILIVGGGINQLELVRNARALGCYVIVTDVNGNPPCRLEADEFFQVDTTDRAETLRVAKSSQLSAVVSDQSDVAVPTVAYVAENLSLPGIGFETSLRFTNKHLMRETIKKTRPDLIPQSTLYVQEADLLKFLDLTQRTMNEWIVKPINSQGSKGVSRLTQQAYKSSISLAFRESRGHGVVLEEFVHGEEFSVESFVVDGQVHHLAVTRKFHYPQNDCIDNRNVYLGDIPLDVESALYEANRAVIASLGLQTGSTHGEFKVNDGRVKLMEIAARGGGGNISGKIIPFLTGFSPTRAVLDFSLGLRPTIEASSYREKFAVLRFFDFPPGRVERVQIDNHAIDKLLHFELNLKKSDLVHPIRSSRDRAGYFIVGGVDRASVLAAEEAALKSVRIEIAEELSSK